MNCYSMNWILLLILHVLLYGIPLLIIINSLKKENYFHFFSYFGVLFVFTQMFAVLYFIKINEKLIITGGNIAYSSIIMMNFMVFITTKNPQIIRQLIYIQIGLNVFLFFLYRLLFFLLDCDIVVNSFSIPPVFFGTTISINLVSSIVFIIETSLMLYLLELVKKQIKIKSIIIFLYAMIFILILMLDGFLFPFLVSFFEPEFGEFIVGGIIGKFILGIAYLPFVLGFILINNSSFNEYLQKHLPIKDIFISKKQLKERLETAEKEVEILTALLPICPSCKKIKNDAGYWNGMVKFFENNPKYTVSKQLCSKCINKENKLILSYFDEIIGPNIILKAPLTEKIDLYRNSITELIDYNQFGYFSHNFGDYDYGNHVFEIPGNVRGRKILIMISFIQPLNGLKNKFVKSLLEEFVKELKDIEELSLYFEKKATEKTIKIVENFFFKFYSSISEKLIDFYSNSILDCGKHK